MVNRFQDRTQASVIGNINNTNDRTGGGGGRGGNAGETTTKRIGATLALERGQFEIGGNARYSGSKSSSWTKSASQNFVTTNTSFSNAINRNVNRNHSINGDFRIEWKVDSMTTMQLRPNFSFGGNNSNGTGENATFNADRSAVDITADLNSQAAMSGLSVGFVLTADSVTGTERAWKQANYYYQYQPSQLPDDLKQFGNGGVNGGSSFFWIFNDVAIGSYYEGGKYEKSIGSIGNRETKTVTATVEMPTKAVLVNALRYDLITANVFVLDDKGVVANAAKVRVVDPTDVKELDVKPAGNLREVARYTLDGRMITTPQKGINIVRLSDGSTIKVNVK